VRSGKRVYRTEPVGQAGNRVQRLDRIVAAATREIATEHFAGSRIEPDLLTERAAGAPAGDRDAFTAQPLQGEQHVACPHRLSTADRQDRGAAKDLRLKITHPAAVMQQTGDQLIDRDVAVSRVPFTFWTAAWENEVIHAPNPPLAIPEAYRDARAENRMQHGRLDAELDFSLLQGHLHGRRFRQEQLIHDVNAGWPA
jgi:hypothetical protein